MDALVRAHDWAATPLGPAEAWPHSLRMAVRIVLTSRFAMWMGWGPDLTFLYNDAYARMTLGAKHPWALGRPAREVWAEIWEDIGPRIRTVMETGTATWDEALQLFLERSGYREETYHTFSYSPLSDESGHTAGMLCVVSEETDRVIGDRRLSTLRELAARLAATRSEAEVLGAVEEALGANPLDLPFTLAYLLDAEGGEARLACRTGVGEGMPADIRPGDAGDPWRLDDVAAGAVMVADVPAALRGAIAAGAWAQPPRRAAVVPIARPGQERPAGFLVAGLNPFRLYDAACAGFVGLLAGQVAASLASARAQEEERRRAEALAELDRAKTAFFSNVSHEFRTPLTLLLGPLEDLLRHPGTDDGEREALELAHRNALRLLKLVNTLLDFSRVEAGRVDARFEPTDLSALTAELASTFRSACERAGLALEVDAPPLGEPVLVDRDMWEKVVLNLVSNAFKHTFEGGIAVRVRREGPWAVLSVSDTGVGIAAEELPRLFDRFHRVANARSRTHEGTGIGLALVQELVRRHEGAVEVESREGEGSTFTVRVPLGRGHLPAERAGDATRAPGAAAAAYALEAARWLPGAGGEEGASVEATLVDAAPVDGARDLGEVPEAADGTAARVLLADDNADVREYVSRLLRQEGWEVESVADGAAALAAARACPPDLVLSDVMMPGLDGFALLAALRADPATSTLPVILLSARAGEEARVEGAHRGADDYLVKPFSAQELVARVGAHLALARERRRAAAEAEAAWREAELARDAAEAASRAKSEFLAVMSHELRTPLNAIAGHVELMEMGIHGPVTGAQAEALERIARNQRHLLGLINDVLNLARIETGRVEYVLGPVRLDEAVRELEAMIEPQLRARALAYAVRLPERPLVAWADREKLVQVLLNLLGNAAKFTPVGGRVEVEAEADGGPPEVVRVHVRDTGIGIPPEKLQSIFEPFVQVRSDLTRVNEGAGLGLAISRDLSRGMGAELSVTSEPGRGSTFTLTLPAAP